LSTKNAPAVQPPASPVAAPAAPVAAAPATPAPAAPASPPAPPTPNAASLITSTANGSNHGTKVDLQAVYQAVIYGLLTFYQATDVFQMAAGTFTRDELIAEFQTFVTAAQSTKTSNQQWRANIQTERGLELHVRELRTGVRGITTARFGAAGAQNLQFGFNLPKPRTKSAETKAVAVAKSAATRKERGTLGSVQKKDIKGNVNVALVVTPGDAPAQPQNGGAQAASAPPQAAAPIGAPPVTAPTNGASPTAPVTPAASPASPLVNSGH
jgi:hypothetical protein